MRSGFMGENGRGTHEHHKVMGRVDILTGTLGKALGGASGGYTSARKEIVDLLRQRSRPYLFSNSCCAGDCGRVAQGARAAGADRRNCGSASIPTRDSFVNRCPRSALTSCQGSIRSCR